MTLSVSFSIFGLIVVKYIFWHTRKKGNVSKDIIKESRKVISLPSFCKFWAQNGWRPDENENQQQPAESPQKNEIPFSWWTQLAACLHYMLVYDL